MRGLRQYRYLDLITAIFITVLVVSNIQLASPGPSVAKTRPPGDSGSAAESA